MPTLEKDSSASNAQWAGRPPNGTRELTDELLNLGARSAFFVTSEQKTRTHVALSPSMETPKENEV